MPPTNDDDAIRAVKWHPKDADTLAIASDNKFFVIDLANTQVIQGHSVPHSDLFHLGPVFNVPSVNTSLGFLFHLFIFFSSFRPLSLSTSMFCTTPLPPSPKILASQSGISTVAFRTLLIRSTVTTYLPLSRLSMAALSSAGETEQSSSFFL